MSLMVWLPLNGNLENFGASAASFTGTPTYSTGKIGQCLSNGTITSTNTTLPVTLTTAQEYSMCSWVKMTSTNTWIWNMGTGTSTTRGLWIGGANQGPHFAYSGSGAFTGSTVINDGKWHHVCFTVKGTVSRAYVDGVDCGGSTGTRTDVAGDNGIRLYATSICSINDFRLYSHCLSAAEVHEIAQGLVLHYRLNTIGAATGIPNLATNSSSFSGWTVGSGWTKIEENGSTVYHFERTGATSNNWVRLIPPTQIIASDYPNGITVSLDFKCVDVSAINQKCIGSLQQYQSNGSRVGWVEPAWDLSKVVNNQWIRLSHTFSQSELSRNNTSGTTYAYTMFSFQLVQNGSIYLKHIKIEGGTQATEYSLAASDYGAVGIQDCSGYNHNGTIYGSLSLSSSSARYSSCLYIPNGNTDYIYTNEGVGNPTDAITLNIWFKSENKSPGSGYHHMMNGLTSWVYIEMAVHQNGYLRCGLYINGTRYVANTSNTNLLDGNWHMLTMTYDGAQIKRYVDGVLRTEATQNASGTIDRPNDRFVFGRGASTGYYCKEAYISDARIYATGLSAEDVKALYEVGAKVDNKQSFHTYELVESGTLAKIHKTGVTKHNKFVETSILNSGTTFSYTPTANTNNACASGVIMDFTDFANDGQELTCYLEYDISWSGLAAGSGGTFRTLIQGSNRKKEGNSWVWEGANYTTGDNFTSLVTANATGSVHRTKTFTIPATWFNTYNASYFGIRTDYANGTGSITIYNIKLMVASGQCKIRKNSINAENFIEM